MKKSNLSLFKSIVKHSWRASLFCYSTIFIHSSVNTLLASYNDKEKGVYKDKRKNNFDFFATISLKIIPISYCSCQLVYKCDNNNALPTETEYNNLELFKRVFFKLIQYEYFIIHKIIRCINEFIIFVLYSLANFYLYFHSIFFNICNLLSKIYHGESNNGSLHAYPNIPYNIINSFVTIHKIYEHNKIPLKHDFKNDQLEYMGSEFIYDKRGYILTAAHNITNLEDKFVVKNNNGLYFATLLGLHKGSDVCVMKINSEEPFSYISLDKIRDELKQGESVVTYGQIQDFDKETYSVGMSGSPLLDQYGNLVGMIQKKIDNYGLALPANILKNVAIHLQNKGVYKEPFLGIVFREKALIIQNSRSLTKELKISSILANSSADLGNLKKEDIISKINNKDIESICDVHEIINSTSDRYINVDGIRNDKKFKTQSQTKSLDYPRTRIYENINKKEDLEYKAFKNISFNKLKTSLKNFLVLKKKINISNVKYVSFLGKYYNYEKIDNYGVNEICILGRSNVGKSTFLRNFIKYLINVNDNKNIKVSKRSGCTRSINLYSFENAKKKKLFILTDMPGLGYAEGIGEKKMEYLKKNLDDYVYLRNQICLFFILIDMSVDIQKIDISLMDAIRKTSIPLRVICTKCDKFNGNVNHRLNGIKTFYKLEKTPIHISKFSNNNYINIFKEIQYHCNLDNS